MTPTAVLCALLILAWSGSGAAQRRERLPAPLRLEHALQVAELHRREIDAAQAQASAAGARPAIVSAPEDPMVMASVDHFPLEQIMGVDWSVMVRQTFPLGDLLGSRVRVAQADARRLQRETDRIALDVQAEAAMAFLELYVARRTDAVIAEQIALTEQLVAASRARYASGLGGQAEALRAESELARLRAERSALGDTIDGSAAMLATAMGLPAVTRIPELAEPTDTTLPSRRAAIDRALRQRPELAALRDTIAREDARVSEMRSMYWPMMTVGVGGSYTMTEGAGVMGSIGLSIPIFRDRLDAGVSEAQSMRAMASGDLGAMRRMIEGQTASAWSAARAARTRRDALRNDVVPRARQTIDAAFAQYGAGQLPQVSAIESMRALFDVQLDVLRAEVDAAMAEVRLRRALGRMR